MLDNLKLNEDAKLWRIFGLWSLSGLLGLTLIFFGYFYQVETHLNNQAHSVNTIIDHKEDNGQSTSDLITDTNFNFELKDGFKWPFAGVEYKLSDSNNVCFDLSYIKTIDLNIKSDVEVQIVLSIKTWEEGRTRPNLWSSYRLLSRRMEIYPGENHLSIPIQLFHIPDWWRNINKVPWNSTELFLDKVCLVELIVSDSVGKQGSIEIQNLSSLGTPPLQRAIFIPLGFLFLILNSLIVFHLFKQAKQLKSKRETIKEMDSMPTSTIDEWSIIQKCLIDNFKDSELNIEKLGQLSQIPVNRIIKVLKEKTGLSMRSFLNSLRVNHAKKLLIESDEQVAQVAKLCGYSSTPHFNRTFKSEFSLNPTEFRKQNKSSL
jgi:AraC-like DNA-binding protein